ncbi:MULTISPECIES: hypothetical protein [unclassified Sinorhizobium]|uniref:hypothetical protein n=1 Tax=unclassified Sinorhizobium TaxID=2613772 RepID=UPI003525145B
MSAVVASDTAISLDVISLKFFMEIPLFQKALLKRRLRNAASNDIPACFRFREAIDAPDSPSYPRRTIYGGIMMLA